MNYGLEREPAKEPSLVGILCVQYYSKAITAEGVSHEVRYEETMLRRPSHVWRMRLPPPVVAADRAVKREHSVHKQFNSVLLPCHGSAEWLGRAAVAGALQPWLTELRKAR
ncbi:hypothetical protein ACN9MZ_05195 [Pseudoduganella sp. S-14]|uniref:hypothetical protein n=1 Tax=Pseudoduganella sp. S-14 TaxID=3404065 RepID=UPI003CE7DB3F